jgi:hypothetical protein
MFTGTTAQTADLHLPLDPFAGEVTELFCFDVDLQRSPGHVQIAAGHPATLVASWRGQGSVEVAVAGQTLVVEHDHDGAGIRVVDRASGEPLVGYTPKKSRLRRRSARPSGARPGTVRLADGRILQWVPPTGSDFECGFFKGPRNVLRFAYDGTAIFCSGRAAVEGMAGAGPEKVALLVLGWLLLIDAGRIPAGVDEFVGVPAYADVPEQGGATVLSMQSRIRSQGRGAARLGDERLAG